MNIFIDFETYSRVNLKKVGAWNYSMHPSTEVICMAYVIEHSHEEAIQVYIPEVHMFPFGPFADNTYIAWNSFFDMCIMHNVVYRDHQKQFPNAPFPTPNLSQWIDAASHALVAGLPGKLELCAQALGYPEDQQKSKAGKILIEQLCKPDKYGQRHTDEFDLRRMHRYCTQDIIVMQRIYNSIPALSEHERKIWVLDQTINLRGIPFDVDSCNHAVNIIDIVATQQAAKVTANLYQNPPESAFERVEIKPTQTKLIKAYAEAWGCPIPDCSKASIIEALERDDLPAEVRRLFETRQSGGKTSTSKYQAIVERTWYGRAYGTLQYHGAFTGRWAGRGIQPHNFKRPELNDPEGCIRLLPLESPDAIEMIYGPTMAALSSCLRGMIYSEIGLYVADFSSIEARVLAWFAGQQDKLQVFKTHGKVYEFTASQIYHVPMEQITKDQRFVGKCGELSLGYEGADNALLKKAREINYHIAPEKVRGIVMSWRESNSDIVDFWYKLKRTFRYAVQNPGQRFWVRADLSFCKIDQWMVCTLPSGREMKWYNPGADDRTIWYWLRNQKTYTFGGKLAENVTSGLSRDIMADAMLRLEAAGYPVVLTVHDEILSERADGCLDEFLRLMKVRPIWGLDIPIDAAGFWAHRWRKD